MANQLSRPFAYRLWHGEILWPSFRATLHLLDSTYAFDPSAPASSDTPIAVSELLTGLGVVEGYAQADPVWFTGVEADEREVHSLALVEEGETVPFAFMDDVVGLPTIPPKTAFWVAWQQEGIVRL